MSKSINLRKIIICMTVAIVAMALGLGYSFASSAGTYTTSVSPQYRNPLTGAIEDSGGEEKEALGQGMAQSTVSSAGLVEIDASGNVYATYRINNASAISRISFSTSAGGAFYGVSAVNTKSAGNYADYRIKVPYAGAPVRCSVYVAPMGREVIFFMTSAGLTPGQGDFVSAIDTSAEQARSSQGGEGTASKSEEAKQAEDKKADEKKAEDDKKSKAKKDAKKKTKSGDTSKNKKNSKVSKATGKSKSESKRFVVYGALVIVIVLAAAGTVIYKKIIKK